MQKFQFDLPANLAMKYLHNSKWMLIEQVVKMFTSFFVGIYIARHLEPTNYGLLSYAVAIVTVFSSVSRLGMDSILIRELVNSPKQAEKYMGTVFVLMSLMSVFCFICVSLIVLFIEDSPFQRLYIWIISIGLLFQSLYVIDYAFQARIKAKFTSVAKSLAITSSSFFKIGLVVTDAELKWFAVAFALDQVFIAVALVSLHILSKRPNFLFSFDRSLVPILLKSALPMVWSTLSIILYMRVDQIMINNMLDSQQLGIYAAAVKFYEGWTVIPYIISISILPAITKLKSANRENFENGLVYLFSFVFWSTIIIAVLVTVFGENIIKATFGPSYVDAAETLSILIFAAAFTALGSITARYLIVENMEKKIAVRTSLALTINIGLNLVLIPRYGIEGSAIATLVCLVSANYLIDYTDESLAKLIELKNRALGISRLKNIITKVIS